MLPNQLPVTGLQAALDSEKVGHPVTVDIFRAGKLVQLNVMVGERPER